MSVEDENTNRGDYFEPDEELYDEVEDEEDDSKDNLEDDEDSLDEVEESEEDEEEVKEIMIPKTRLDKERKRADEARERSLWLEEQLEKLIEQNARLTSKPIDKPTDPVPTYNFDQAEENYATLLIEGDISKAAALRKEIDRERQNELKALIKSIQTASVEEATTKVNLANETEKFQSLISTFEIEYPFLDAESDDYNEEAIETVNTLLAGYLASGKTKSEALKLAVKKVVPMFKEDKPVVKQKQSLGSKRTVEANKKAAQAANAQPAKTKTTGVSSTEVGKLNIAKMSEKEFNKLTPKELSILRGD